MNKINLLISIVLLLFSSTAFSQVTNKNRNTYWADAGIGNFISTDNANGRTIQLGANFERDSLLIKISLLRWFSFIKRNKTWKAFIYEL